MYNRISNVLPIDKHKCMSFRNVQSLHRWKLMTSSCIGDLEGTDILITTDNLSIRIFDRRYICVLERVCKAVAVNVV